MNFERMLAPFTDDELNYLLHGLRINLCNIELKSYPDDLKKKLCNFYKEQEVAIFSEKDSRRFAKLSEAEQEIEYWNGITFHGGEGPSTF